MIQNTKTGILLVVFLLLSVAAAKLYYVYQRDMANSPPVSEMIVDKAGILGEPSVRQIHAYHTHLLKAHDIDYRVLTTPDAGDINTLAAQAFKEMEVGSLSKTGKGFLFILDPNHSLTRLEVSANLEGVYTDAFVSYVQRNWTVQYFKGNQINAGILAMTEMFIARAQEAERGQAFDPVNLGANQTTGAGARTEARIGEGYAPAPAAAAPAATGRTPRQVYDALIESYLAGDSALNSGIFTEESAALFARSMPSPAAIKEMGRAWSACRVHSVRERGEFAVITFALDNRRCGPKFLKQEGGAWKFDVPGIAHMVIYDFENRWQLRNDPYSPYMFAFKDWEMRSGQGSVDKTPMLWPLKEGVVSE